MSTVNCNFQDAKGGRRQFWVYFLPLSAPLVHGEVIILKDRVMLRTGKDGLGTIELETGLYDVSAVDNPPLRIFVPDDDLEYDLTELVQPVSTVLEPSFGTVRFRSIKLWVPEISEYREISLQNIGTEIILKIQPLVPE